MSLALDISRLPREVQVPFEQISKEHPFGAEDLRDDSVTDAKLAPPESTVAFPFAVGWAGFNTTTYYKHTGRVYLAGYVNKTNGTVPAAGNVIGTLPAGYRPAVNSLHAVPSGNSANIAGFVRVDTAGVVTWLGGSAAVNDFIGFDGISFRAA